ncbi:MAG: DUF2877 domain-containing protein [Chloroflexi bacterium]|nr:DUF2877 domain-containing protein [Chloroflexota bacterium]
MTAVWVTQFALDWLKRSTAVRVLHVFEQACNLVNEKGDVVSLVSMEIGCGPFAIVVPDVLFSDRVRADSVIRIDSRSIFLGNLSLKLEDAAIWEPCPQWIALQTEKTVWQLQLPLIRKIHVQHQASLHVSTSPMQDKLAVEQKSMAAAIKTNDWQKGKSAIQNLAGLGNGLTPTGDDFLMGVLYGLWATASPEYVELWSALIVETAVSRTTTLSAAWLKAAARGEATIHWHRFVDALVGHGEDVETAVRQLLAIGHSSGTDALNGFLTIISN